MSHKRKNSSSLADASVTFMGCNNITDISALQGGSVASVIALVLQTSAIRTVRTKRGDDVEVCDLQVAQSSSRDWLTVTVWGEKVVWGSLCHPGDVVLLRDLAVGRWKERLVCNTKWMSAMSVVLPFDFEERAASQMSTSIARTPSPSGLKRSRHANLMSPQRPTPSPARHGSFTPASQLSQSSWLRQRALQLHQWGVQHHGMMLRLYHQLRVVKDDQVQDALADIGAPSAPLSSPASAAASNLRRAGFARVRDLQQDTAVHMQGRLVSVVEEKGGDMAQLAFTEVASPQSAKFIVCAAWPVLSRGRLVALKPGECYEMLHLYVKRVDTTAILKAQLNSEFNTQCAQQSPRAPVESFPCAQLSQPLVALSIRQILCRKDGSEAPRMCEIRCKFQQIEFSSHGNGETQGRASIFSSTVSPRLKKTDVEGCMVYLGCRNCRTELSTDANQVLQCGQCPLVGAADPEAPVRWFYRDAVARVGDDSGSMQVVMPSDAVAELCCGVDAESAAEFAVAVGQMLSSWCSSLNAPLRMHINDSTIRDENGVEVKRSFCLKAVHLNMPQT